MNSVLPPALPPETAGTEERSFREWEKLLKREMFVIL